MKRLITLIPLFFVFLFSFGGCDHGLGPSRPVQPGFSGIIRFQGTWPQDTLELRLIASQAWRKFTSFTEIIALVVNTDSVKIYPPPAESGLPMGHDSVHYEFPVPASTYRYVAVVQRFGTNPFADWRIIGVYDGGSGTNEPKDLVVPTDQVVSGIDILVDFSNPPPQPFQEDFHQ
ncbi:MAG: hypothetical protein ABSB78_05255 [Bacteroidota bacterium]